MRRAALIAGISAVALACAAPIEVQAFPGDLYVWGGNGGTIAPRDPEPRKAFKPRPRPAEHTDAKNDKSDKAPPPSGVLHIIVSIDKQRATLFADGVPYASTAISSGTAGHPTPTGVFTIIQKSRHHVSNLYGAAMPYMQRITWSGSALHQGPLPGYPASHGCVRLTENFAQLLWKATKMGARVIVTRPEVAPLEIEHARLFVPRPKLAETPPQPAAPLVKVVEAPRASVSDGVEPATTATVAPVNTAEAANGTAEAVMSLVGDATKPVATSVVTKPEANTPGAEQPTKLATTDGASGAAQAAATETKPAAVEQAEAKPVEAKPAEPVTAEAKPIETQTQPAATEPAAAAAIETKPAPEQAEGKPVDVNPVQPATAEAKPVQTLAAPAPIIVDERPKTMPAATVREANGRPISVFASLKEGKLYVRQGWKPLFDAPVSFENPGQPIGTHVYTAMGVKADGKGLRWTVVSIPSNTRRLVELKETGRRSRTDHLAKPVDLEAPLPSPNAALDRIVMTPELVERISELMTPGSSLIVSDNKLSDETGEYTDFIVMTR